MGYAPGTAEYYTTNIGAFFTGLVLTGLITCLFYAATRRIRNIATILGVNLASLFVSAYLFGLGRAITQGQMSISDGPILSYLPRCYAPQITWLAISLLLWAREKRERRAHHFHGVSQESDPS